MRTIKEILRLCLVLSLPYRKIEVATGAGRGTVAEYIKKARNLGLTWQQIEPLSESELEEKLLSGGVEVESGSLSRFPTGQRLTRNTGATNR
jgi:hypothetical protein